jgi:hypothetical protein
MMPDPGNSVFASSLTPPEGLPFSSLLFQRAKIAQNIKNNYQFIIY